MTAGDTDTTRVKGVGVAGTDEQDTAVERPGTELGRSKAAPTREASPAVEDALPEGGDEATRLVPESRKRFGRFELLLELAKGGMATLYLARVRGPEGFEKTVVVKRIHEHFSSEAQFTQMFLDEARISALIHHPNVAGVFDLGRVEQSYFLAMEYVHGQNLSEVLRAAARQREAFTWQHAVRIVADAAAGLHAAHELKDSAGEPMQVVHRDVSPANILLSFDGNVKVVDFGIAYAAQRYTKTATGTLKGKVAYMSPEQVQARATVDRRTDIFALGIVLWECCVMKRLFREETEAQSLMRVRDVDVPPPRSLRPELPATLERIIMRALAGSPAERYATAAELETELQELLTAEGRYVGSRDLAAVMDRLFHDRKRIKDAEIQRALQDRPPREPAVAVGYQTPASETDLEVGSELVPRRGPSRLLVGVIGGGVAVALALILFVVLRSWEPTPERTPAKPAAPASIAAPTAAGPRSPATRPLPVDRVTIRLTFGPVGVNPVVTFRGQKYAGADFSATVPRTGNNAVLAVEAPGYLRRNVIVSLTGDVTQTVILKPAGRKSPPEARPRPPRAVMKRNPWEQLKTF